LKIADFAKRNQIPLEVAVDVGCGSGQSTLPLGSYCQRVIGTDISHEQIKQAVINNTSHDNVTYKVASADKLPFGDEEVSMVTCGQAWHWFDPPTVNSEIVRIIKRPGCIAIYGHVLPVIQNVECAQIMDKFYSQTLKGYWHNNRKFVDEKYEGLSLPLPLKERINVNVVNTISLDEYFGYVDTWSGYQSYLKSNPGTEILAELKEKIKMILADGMVNLVTSYFIFCCLKL
jgi:ubiquinone/menaquinone biosynthesis C-methylase UbiE